MGQPRVMVCMGGDSLEREISLLSGQAIISSIESIYEVMACDVQTPEQLVDVLYLQKPDIVFNVIHGGFGEHGHVSAVCELLGIPYIGSNICASAVTMDKIHTKEILQANGLPTLPFKWIQTQQDIYDAWEQFGAPICIKPSNQGSSIGVHCLNNYGDIDGVYQSLVTRYKRILVEPWIQGRELTVGFLNHQAQPLIEIIPAVDFYDYEAKYHRDDTLYRVVKDMSKDRIKAIQKIATHAFQVLGMHDWGRIDFLAQGDDIWILEANTVPGLTSRSLLPMAAREQGTCYQEMICGLINRSWGSKVTCVD